MLFTIAPRTLRVALLALTLAALSVAPAMAQDPSANPGGVAEPSPSVVPSPAPSATPPLAIADPGPGSSWVVRAYDPWAEGLLEARPKSELTVDLLADGRLQGLTGCGTYFGSYRLDGQDASFSVTTKGPDPCGPKRIEEAVAFIAALESTAAWSTTSTGLELLDGNGTLRMRLDPLAVATLEGEWAVIAVARSDGRLDSLPPDAAVGLTFSADDRLYGSTGCRLLKGEYTSEADQVLILPSRSAGLPCEGDDRKTERRLLRALELVVLWQRDGEALLLTDSAGATLISLVPAAP